jgi:GTPase SAR1 family protein
VSTNLAQILRGHFSKLPIGGSTPQEEVAKKVLGGEGYRKIFESRIKPVISALHMKMPAGHIIVVGRRGTGKTHLCYRIIGEAEEHNIPCRHITPKENFDEILGKGLTGIVKELGSPSILVIDEIDEYLREDAATTEIREKLTQDFSKLIDIADREPITLVISGLSEDLLKKLFTPSAWSKLAGEKRIVSATGEYMRRAEPVNLDKLWDELDVKSRVETLIDILYSYIYYYVNNTPQLRTYSSVLSKDGVKALLDHDLWSYLARLDTVGTALKVLRRVLEKLDEKGERLILEDLGEEAARIYEVLSQNVASYYEMRTWKDRLKRIARNIGELLVALGYAEYYAVDVSIPRGVKKGWVKVDVSLTMRDGLQLAIVVPTLEKSLYIKGKETTEKISKLLSFSKLVKSIVLLAPVDAERSVRRLVSSGELAKATAERRLITALIDGGELFLLLSDLTLKAAEKWRRIQEVRDMLKQELESIKDLSGRPFISKLTETRI